MSSQEFYDYALDFCHRHVDLRHTPEHPRLAQSRPDAMQQLSGQLDMTLPCMLIGPWDAQIMLLDFDNVKQRSKLAFAFVQAADLTDTALQVQAKENCLALCREFLAKMIHDHAHDLPAMRGLEIGSIDYTEVGPIFGAVWGVEVNFSAISSAAITYTPEHYDPR